MHTSIFMRNATIYSGEGHRTVTKTVILITVPVAGCGDDPLFHSITHSLLSLHKFADVL
jgi:hypothetical protein